MTTTQTYKVLFNNIAVRSKPSLFSSILGRLKKGTTVELIDIRGLWACILYNNKKSYVITYYLEKVEPVITGSTTIRYLNSNTNVEILPSVTNDNLTLKTYSYTAPSIENYTVIEPSTKSITLTNSNPNQEIVFYYKENIIYGSITVNYVEKSSNNSISSAKTDNNLKLGTYSYNSLDIAGYKISGDSSKSVTLTKDAKDQSITFEYDKILGKITIEYVDTDTKVSIATSDVYSNLDIGSYNYSAKTIDGYTLVNESSQTATLIYSNNEIVLTFEYKKNLAEDDIYVIDLKKYGISNDNTNANATTIGINKALVDAKAAGYKRVKLPEGIYALNTDLNLTDLNDKNCGYGILMQSDMELILTNCTLQQVPCEDPHYSIIKVNGCKNSKITDGTIFGDRDTHNYGMRINNNKDMFESGDIDSSTGNPKIDDTRIRTKDYISVYKDWFTGKEEPLPNTFYITPLWNTSKNTVDGGCRYIYCYDKNNNYLGITGGSGIGYIKYATLLENTAKIKISLKDEKRLDVVLAMTKRMLWYTYEFGCGIEIRDSNNIEINGTIIKNCIGDCTATGGNVGIEVNDLRYINCTFENSRRQGISLTSYGKNYLIQNCNIGSINGVDPQCGIDFETGGEIGKIYDVLIDNCNFYDNKKWDIINYDGSITEIKNSNFTGAIATTGGHTMSVHNNVFKYKDTPNNDKVYKKVSLQLDTHDNIVYDNEFIDGNAINSGENSKTYNNVFKNATMTITNNDINKYYDSKIYIRQNSSLPKLENNYFENSIIYNNTNTPSIEVYKCEFKNSTYYARGETLVNECIFNMTDKPIVDEWLAQPTVVTYKNCTINSTYESKIPLLGYNSKITANFEGCKFCISRYWLGRINMNFTFNLCNFIFNDLNQSNDLCYLNTFDGNNSWTPSNWYLNDCHFKSSFPIKITGGNIINPTIDGPISIA